MAVIKLPDKQTAALKAKAMAEGLSLEAWLQKLAEQKHPARHWRITNVILENMRAAPPELMAHIPKDDAVNPVFPACGNPGENKP